MQNQTSASGSPSGTKAKVASPKIKSKTLQKAKGIIRWHGAVSTNLVNQKVLIPKNESTSESDSGSFDAPENKKKSLGQKMKAALGKVVSSKPTKMSLVAPEGTLRTDSPRLAHKQKRLPGVTQHLPLPREISKRTSQTETARITPDNVVLRSRRTSRRVSVTSVPSGLQKVSYSPKKKHFAFTKKKKKKPVEIVRYQTDHTMGKLQMQVDELIETIADKSTRLLAQRHEELRQCESLGDEILQSSKQFQRVSKKRTRKYKFKNVCFPCICCC
ncbi:putative uncharacterized protein C3orf49 homolog isoform X2 [Spea bombifrons]|uniref:putative uncharacterized protein C3orf49 homolog isoform X2 n=1 Tax=Spea bombifrons TaxID=233779 RepID=UPI00234AFD7E|nr:putative uncharacterized protein C3orf49 homolog isoform X2 [Spea bombifrons]